MADPPTIAAWRHVDARDGFEVLFIRREHDGYVLEGHATAMENSDAWGVRYAIAVDRNWTTRRAHIAARSTAGTYELELDAGNGSWRLDGRPVAALDGCLDVDLEASACTNALPVHRLALGVGDSADAPAAYVRAVDLSVERLEQRYTRLADDEGRSRYDYSAPVFSYRDVLVYDEFGFVVDYPGLAVRIA
jgi:uncharacterized protein